MALKNQLTKSDYLKMDEYNKLIKGLHKDRAYLWELYVVLSFATALRSSDVRSLMWSDVLYRDSFVKTEKKTRKTRKITLGKQAQQRIRELYEILKSPNPNELIFQNTTTKRPFTIQYINRIMKHWRVKYRLNVGNFSTHTFRKTFGRYVYDSSENKSEALIILNSILNHTSINETKVYIGLRDDEISNIYRSLYV